MTLLPLFISFFFKYQVNLKSTLIQITLIHSTIFHIVLPGGMDFEQNIPVKFTGY